jgi:hypothetical protein
MQGADPLLPNQMRIKFRDVFFPLNSRKNRKKNQKSFPLEIHLELYWKNSEAATVSKSTTVL